MSATDLAGLTPEQVANVSKINAQNEALRQEGIANIFRAVGQTGQAEYMTAMAEKIRHPERQAQYDIAEELIKKSKTPEEIDKLKADAYQAYQSGRLSEQRANEIDRLLDEKEEALRLGNDLRVAELDEYLTVLFPSAEGGVEEGLVKAGDIARIMAGAAGESDLPERKFLTQQEQQAVAIEETIRDRPKSDAALAQYQDFNRYSNRPRVAIKIGNKIEFVDLPRVGGRIITARDVYKAAQAVNMSVEEYLRDVLKVPIE